ncbi:DUF4173 domain-containing protein [Microvirga splendida]|uniref:DUF4173 domain-containing protein n=1 Tax=Microvirga splendida TaxID=2795727 RepID=A0ABS0Y556_9HYPH|nr:DUF4173 domain-containing protein [Microvirga splendida]MBJ6127438.1 DUF4173 domain-containing protein [Microvirga splendida]
MTAVFRPLAILAHSTFGTKLALAFTITAFGDWLFYDHDVGVSLAMFLVVLAGGACLMSPVRKRRTLLAAATLLTFALLPLLEDTGTISILFGILGTALAAIVMTGGASRGWNTLAASTQRLLLTGAFQIIPDFVEARQEAQREGRQWMRLDAMVSWIVPVLCCAVFIALFASANPLIEQWLAIFDVSRQSWEFDVVRLAAWIILLAVAWPFLSVRLCEKPLIKRGLLKVDAPSIKGSNLLFGPAAILRSLVIFNVLFAVQSGLDAVYLWSGAALPEGMTYATYAHRGAYPLIITALLAAGFVLAAMRPGGSGEQSPIIRQLVYLWVAQNVLLVTSSILRLELYVATYSLTLLRMAAFIWMLLVAVGLILIMARIALRRSNGWLVGANVLSLALTLYVCSFVNFAAVIANHNLSYRRETMPGATSIDAYYIRTLGPHVIPAVDRYIARKHLTASDHLVQWRNRIAVAHGEQMNDWRAWTFRDLRLQHYLAGRMDGKAATSTTFEQTIIP